jgi:hypothetical protein
MFDAMPTFPKMSKLPSGRYKMPKPCQPFGDFDLRDSGSLKPGAG